MITVRRYSADWCGPCKMLKPLMETLEAELPDIKFETINIDTETDATAEANVRNVPTVLIIKDGVEVKRLIGVQPKRVYLEAINEA